MATLPAPDDDVEKILTGMMQRQSPLMKQARTQGLQQAQNAGLGNSTMGIKAAQAAAYNAALPIASQQAQQGFQKGMQQAEFGQQTGMQQAEFGHQTGMQQAEFGQQTGMQKAQFGHETGMQTSGFQHAATQAELDRLQQRSITDRTAYLDRLKMHEGTALERGTLAIQQQHDANMQAQDRATQERLASMELSAAERERAMASVSNANQAWSASYSAIMQNADLPAAARENALKSIDWMWNNNQSLTTSLYKYSVPW